MIENQQLLILIAAAAVSYFVAKAIFTPIAKRVAAKTENQFDDLLIEKGALSRLVHLLPATVIATGYHYLPASGGDLYLIVGQLTGIYFVWIAYAVLCSFLNAIEAFHSRHSKFQNRPLLGIFQAIKLLGFCVCAILFVSQLTHKSPLIILSSLGVAASLLMLVFKETIVGFVAGIQINVQDLIRKGDWVEIPRHGADGDVIDISLTSVRIRNWNKTISVVPTSDLVSNSFTNWRGMFEGGGRRIKRALLIDAESIRFLTAQEIERLKLIKLLEPYLAKMQAEIASEGSDSVSPLNGTRLTNIGTFRAYCKLYLEARPDIRQDMLLVTRLLDPTPHGIPLEVYAFTADTRFVVYEQIQSDIFDHLMTALPEFGLRMYQYPGYVPEGKG